MEKTEWYEILIKIKLDGDPDLSTVEYMKARASLSTPSDLKPPEPTLGLRYNWANIITSPVVMIDFESTKKLDHPYWVIHTRNSTYIITYFTLEEADAVAKARELPGKTVSDSGSIYWGADSRTYTARGFAD